jgi:hypothetical protein
MTHSLNPTAAISWNTHSLLTRASLSNVESTLIHEKTSVTDLEDFLLISEEELVSLARRHTELLKSSFKDLTLQQGVPQKIRTVHDFLRAFRLNPNVVLHYVRALRPEEVSPDFPHSLDRSGPPGGVYAPTAKRDDLSAGEIFITFSDEPDWGMDQDLFQIESYGMGRPPFGGSSGLSSQASFHMAFLDSRLMLPRIVPRLRKSFMPYRITQFWNLADLAFEKRCAYWGWRFNSWAMHYLQDITQPYHAHPFPPSVLRMIRILLVNPGRNGLLRGMGNYLKNRHILCESVVHFLLNNSVKKGLDHPFLQALSQGEEAGIQPLPTLLTEAARIAVSSARRTDKVMFEMINEPRIEDPNYAAGDDLTYPLEGLLSDSLRHRPLLYHEFVELIAKCLVQTGTVTRFAVERVMRAKPRF